MKRIVVKVGSTLLATEGNLRLRYAFIYGLLRDLADLRERGYDVVLMSSGAVALGCDILKRDPTRASIETKQAASAVGQPVLINAYKQIAKEMNLDIAQVLISLAELDSEDHYYDISNTIESLFEYPIIPIVNENDTVATKELRVGDNDRIAACVARMINAESLIILTSIDGVYTANPDNPEAEFVSEIVDPEDYMGNYNSKIFNTQLSYLISYIPNSRTIATIGLNAEFALEDILLDDIPVYVNSAHLITESIYISPEFLVSYYISPRFRLSQIGRAHV